MAESKESAPLPKVEEVRRVLPAWVNERVADEQIETVTRRLGHPSERYVAHAIQVAFERMHGARTDK